MTATAQAARGEKIKTDPPRGRVSDLHAAPGDRRLRKESLLRKVFSIGIYI
jgi:hypothetical protein